MSKETSGTQASRELLQRCVKYCIHNGLADLSLRALAEAVGTSHRMLLYHFGSREQLMSAVRGEVRHRQLEAMGEDLVQVQSARDFERVVRRIWARISARDLHPFLVAFFESYVTCLRRDEKTSEEFLRAALDDWLEPIMAALKRVGLRSSDAATLSRLMLSSVRGLLLDLLASGDRKRVDDAFELLVTMVSLRLKRE